MPVLRVAKNIRNTLSSILIMAMVAACGGSGPAGAPSPTGGGTTGDTGDTSVPNYSLELNWDMDPDSNTVTDAAPRSLNIKLSEGTEPVGGEIVEVTTTLGSLFPSSGNVITDSQTGIATIQLDVSGTEDNEAGAINVVYTDADGASVAKRLNFNVSIQATTDPTTISYSLESQFYSTAVLNDSDTLPALQKFNTSDTNTIQMDDGSDAISLNDFNSLLIKDSRNEDIGSTVNSVQNSVFAIRLTRAGSNEGRSGVVVDFSSTVGTIIPSNGKALTNLNGVAYVIISANGEDPGAAGEVIASIGNTTATKPFAIGDVTLEIGSFTSIPETSVGSPLAVGGTASLTIEIVKADGEPFVSEPLIINLESDCTKLGLASVDSSVTTKKGIAEATYQLKGCDLGEDVITASVDGLSGLSADLVLDLPVAEPKSIQFVSAEPLNIALKGTGGTGRQEYSDVIFKVVDEAGLPISNKKVSVVLTTNVGGITLTGDADGDGLIDNEVLVTNNDGEVSAKVNAGNIATGVRLIATELDSGVVTTSDQLVISTGLPDSDSMSLSASNLAPGGYDIDGIKSTITIRSSDIFNNPVPEGTVVYFRTEYGKVEDFCTMPAINSDPGNDEIESGVCSVVWTSQNPRQNQFDYEVYNNDADVSCVGLVGVNTDDISDACKAATSAFPTINQLGNVYGGHTTILAYALGEETFVDSNGDGLYNLKENGDPEDFTNLPEVFLDHNGDGVFGSESTEGACNRTLKAAEPELFDEGGRCETWKPGGEYEIFIDSGAAPDGKYDWGIEKKYNGSLCDTSISGFEQWCETQLVYVSDDIELNAGGSNPKFGFYDESSAYLANADVTIASGDNSITERRVYITDVFNGMLPNGTTVTVAADNCKLSGITSFEFVNTSENGNEYFPIYLSEDTETENASGVVSVTVTVPDSAGGITITDQFRCSDDQ